MGGDLSDLCYSRGATAFVEDVTTIVSDEVQLLCVEDAIKRCDAVAGAKNNQEKSVDL